MFGREMRTKLPELRRETVEVPRKEVRNRDWSNKLKGKAYADARRSATPKSTVLLEAEKSNKLSTNFRPNPFKVVQKIGTEVTVRNEAREESQSLFTIRQKREEKVKAKCRQQVR